MCAEHADREKGVKIAKNVKKGIKIAMFRVQPWDYMERVGNLRQHVHEFPIQINLKKPKGIQVPNSCWKGKKCLH